MINLLPDSYKTDIRYARRNSILRKWLLAASAALFGLNLIIMGGLVYMEQNTRALEKDLEASQLVLKSQKVDDTEKQLDQISGNTKLAIQVLSREVLFSKLLKQIGASLPNNTALKSLQINNVQGGIQLSAEALDFNAATQLQVNLQDPKNGVFEKADINSITCNPETGEDGQSTATETTASLYPCDVSLQALFGKNTTYNYIVPGAKQ